VTAFIGFIQLHLEKTPHNHNFVKNGGFVMPEDINKYRLTSMEEPTEEMLAQIMHEVAVEAKETTEKARKEYFEKLRQSIKESK